MRGRPVSVVLPVLREGREERVRIGSAVLEGGEAVLLDWPTLPDREQPHAPANTDLSQRRLADLEYLAERSRRTLADPRKARWHPDVSMQLARIEDELERLRRRQLQAAFSARPEGSSDSKPAVRVADAPWPPTVSTHRG